MNIAEAMHAVLLAKEGYLAVELRRLDGHWCDITLVNREVKPGVHLSGVHISIELNDSQIAALTDWITQ